MRHSKKWIWFFVGITGISCVAASPASAMEKIKLLSNFNRPSGVFFDEANKRLYVADTGNNRIVSFDSEFNYVAEFNAGGKLKHPVSIVRNRKGHFYFIEGKKRELFFIDIPGKTFRPVKIIDAPKRANPVYPGRLAIDHNDNLYLTDRANGRILVLDPQGRCIREIALKNKLMDFSDLRVDRDGNVYAVSTLEGKVYLFNNEGKMVSSFGKRGSGEQEFLFPVSIAFDQNGLVYVPDQHKGSVLVFDKEGKFLFNFSRRGHLPGELERPSHIFVDSDGKVYITDRGNDRIQIFIVETNKK